MKCQVLEPFKVRISQGEIELQPGQIITLDKDKAIKLLKEGKIIPTNNIAYKIYSNILQAFLWVVDTDDDMWALKKEGVTDPIYTADEVRKLKGISKEGLKRVHRVKEVFEGSKVRNMQKKGRLPD
ncbi:MAG: hypothetical protein M0022_10380 [Desulfobacteraceae bacterium]|nr:hypothetical protein [Desulfobacteraceae bacterium]